MYHPQRRAILHLKSQRRKLLESNILKVEKSNSVKDLVTNPSNAFPSPALRRNKLECFAFWLV
jgi:hypothetical protein